MVWNKTHDYKKKHAECVCVWVVYLQYVVNVCARPRVISPLGFLLRGDENLSIRNSQWSNVTQVVFLSTVFIYLPLYATLYFYSTAFQREICIYFPALDTGYFI